MSPFMMLFGLLLLLTFGVTILVMKPTKSEKAVQQRLRMIEGLSTPAGEDVQGILKQEAISDVQWLNEIMQQFSLFVKLQRLLMQAESKWTVGKLLFGSLLIAICVTWGATLWAPAVAGLTVVLGVVAGSAPYLYLIQRRAARFRRFEELLPESIDLMARALRAGHTITSAIEMVSEEVPEPVASEFRRVFEEQNFGLPLREAMLGLTDRVPLPDVRFLVTAILVQKETGGNLAEVLDKTTVVIRERFRLRGQLRIYTAQGRLTGWILAALPFLLFAALSFINPDYERVLLTDPTGQKLIYAGLIMMVIGAWVIRRVIDIKV